MNLPHFSGSARRDLFEIHEYISRDNPEAADRLIEKLENKCHFLVENPYSGTIRDDLAPSLRCFSVGNYVIYFEPRDDAIFVSRVLHGARDASALNFE